MIELEIDGKTIQASQGAMIIQAADNAGIYIPRFCYHKKLSIAANCRMCLVEVEKAPKTLPACATPVAPGMKVFTQSEKTIASQRTVMEFLLINHPLDCPICDQGGECELQDLAMGFGRGISRYNQGKRSVKDKNLGPLVASDMTRCIQCTRCVRFGDEVAGLRELGATRRGEALEITTYVEHAIQSELSGNIIDLCPVGALTSKPFRFTARAWELTQHAAIAPHDCLGSHLYLHTRGEEYSTERHIMRAVPRECEDINEVWLSDRDRYSYTAIDSPQRLTQPLVKKQGQWCEVDWDTALDEAVDRLQSVLKRAGSEQLAALISPSATLEESYLLQKILRSLDCHNIDHRLQQSDFRHQHEMPLAPGLGFPIAALEQFSTVLLVGSNLRQEQPLASQRLRKGVSRGCTVLAVQPIAYDLNMTVAHQSIAAGPDFTKTLARILKALSEHKSGLPEAIASSLTAVKPTKDDYAIAEQLAGGQRVAVLLGAYALNHVDASMVYQLCRAIALLSQAEFGCLTTGANSAGAWLAGAIPHRQAGGVPVVPIGLNAREMFDKPRRAYVLFGVEADQDCAHAAAAVKALNAANVVAFSAYRGGAQEDYADVLLPIAAFGETPATYVNAEGKWQSMGAATTPLRGVQPGWSALRMLAERLELPQFTYQSAEEIRDEVQRLVAAAPEPHKMTWPELRWAARRNHGLHRIAEWPMYRIDSMVRRAKPLQATPGMDKVAVIRINSVLAKDLQLMDGAMVTALQHDSQVTLPLMIDDGIADHHVAIPAGLDVTAGFGDAVGSIELSPIIIAS